jgi:MFS family permease
MGVIKMNEKNDDGGMKKAGKAAFLFVLFFGIVSLFSDMTHEGARSITGQFLAGLGASAVTVGVVAGFGEFIGYALRFFSGRFSDRTRRYWLVMGTGYTINLLSVPLLALAGRWEIAAFLMILERAGRAIRNPARDAMLSHATKEMGRGFGFGLHEAFDQIGATAGPLLVAAVFAFTGSFRPAFAVLIIPAAAGLGVLTLTRIKFSHPETFEAGTERVETKGFSRSYWLYLIAASLIAAGFVDYPLIAYHLNRQGSMPVYWTALLYAAAMGIDAVSALVFGRMYDKRGFSILITATLASFLFAPFVFFGGTPGAVTGVLLWGIGMGAQESIMRAAIADIAPREMRATAYGTFNALYGLSWFIGSALFGFLYDRSLSAAVLFSVTIQATAVPLFFLVRRSRKFRCINPPQSM